jgi:hypothetical protein
VSAKSDAKVTLWPRRAFPSQVTAHGGFPPPVLRRGGRSGQSQCRRGRRCGFDGAVPPWQNGRVNFLFRNAIVGLALLGAAFAAEPSKPGDRWEPFATRDQHDPSYRLAPGVRTVIVGFAMGSGQDANRYLGKQPAGFPADHHVVFGANIHDMSGVGRMFALPKRKKYPHRILLADAEHFLDRHPSQKDRLTVFTLDPAGKLEAIRFVNPERKMASIFAPKP